uniref:Uncharacterized protein n=1 Tax=Anguilla anguilla TaxID=7936 RepID=A0A0E9RID9_ANGAN
MFLCPSATSGSSAPGL